MNNSYIECSNTLGMKSFSTHIYVLKQTAYYTENYKTALHRYSRRCCNMGCYVLQYPEVRY